MKVKDYVHDMILGQKLAIETDFDFYEFNTPHSKCPFLECDVRSIRTCQNQLVLVIDYSTKDKEYML